MTEGADSKFPPLPDGSASPNLPRGEPAAVEFAPGKQLNSTATPPREPSPYGFVPAIPAAPQSAEIPQAPRDTLRLPEDLKVPWSWVHLLFFLVSSIASFSVLPVVVALGLQVYIHGPQFQFQQLAGNASFLVATQVLCFGAVIFFLYMTLGVLRHAPFWSTVGWKKFRGQASGKSLKAWMFPLLGSALAVFVAVSSSRVKGAEDAPIEQLFKDPHAALLLMAMAVLIAPLVEETVFRGYLYPLFAGNFAKLAVRFGTTSGVLLTGFLFGMLHGWQLGWNVALVALLTLVGVIFTYARAITGTVLASFLMHLGYNSLIAVITIFATKGFTVVPPGH
jgi:membrane protease YdiL (CAAX protease family)